MQDDVSLGCCSVLRFKMDGQKEATSEPEASKTLEPVEGQTEKSQLLVKQGPIKSAPAVEYLSSPPENWNRKPMLMSFSDWVFHALGKKLGGGFTHEPEDMLSGDPSPQCTLSPSTQRILKEQVFNDLDPSEIVDYHTHIVGHGDSGSNCFIHENLKTWWRPLHRFKATIFMAAAQVPDQDGGDVQYMSRLVRLIRHFVPSCVLSGSNSDSEERYKHGKHCLLAFDAYYDKDGKKNLDRTTLYVPNDYAFSLVKEFPDCFYAVGSVNPYRRDALRELKRCAENGVTIIKWLPNSMGIDLRDEQCIPFYQKMKDLDLALLIHVGEEHSVDAAFVDDSLGNPLYMRIPLKYGVKVIAAHCATDGHALDTDDKKSRTSRPCFELFLRLMKEDKYKGLLFGDISAVCGFMKVGYLKRLMEETDIHERLVYGSDYPVPAINFLVRTAKLKHAQLITAEECTALKELYDYNPLLFDVASKRLLKSSQRKSLPTSVFREHPLLPLVRKAPPNSGSSVDPDDTPTTRDTNRAVNTDSYSEEAQSEERASGPQQVLVEVEVHEDESTNTPQTTDPNLKDVASGQLGVTEIEEESVSDHEDTKLLG